ncbi:hypothetical protein Hamer_G025059 [Homarus americanus]|uniref:Uncharacterized protein n=1 Tax=Homarus americanus TaxID=6706 RepID=A0A8J5JIZ4_HOMAM|nr:hypothetical protein Hamer_G025059 [Homarus americanus]
MDEEEAQFNEEEEEEEENQEEVEDLLEEIDETFDRRDNTIGGDTWEKTLYDDEGNEISFTFDRLYMVS